MKFGLAGDGVWSTWVLELVRERVADFLSTAVVLVLDRSGILGCALRSRSAAAGSFDKSASSVSRGRPVWTDKAAAQARPSRVSQAGDDMRCVDLGPPESGQLLVMLFVFSLFYLVRLALVAFSCICSSTQGYSFVRCLKFAADSAEKRGRRPPRHVVVPETRK